MDALHSTEPREDDLAEALLLVEKAEHINGAGEHLTVDAIAVKSNQ